MASGVPGGNIDLAFGFQVTMRILAFCEVAARSQRGNAPRGLAGHCLLSKAERKGILKLLTAAFDPKRPTTI